MSLPEYMEQGSMNDEPLTQMLINEGAYQDVHERCAEMMAAQLQIVIHNYIEDACDELRTRLNKSAGQCTVIKFKRS